MEGGTKVELAFRSTLDGRVHAQEGVVAVDAPVLVNGVVGGKLQSPVLEVARVHVARTAVHSDGVDEVLALDVEDVGADACTRADALRVGQLVVHHAFGLEVGRGRREHVHLADDGIAEALAHQRLDVGIARGMESEAALRDEFGAGDGVPVDAQSGIDGQPLADVLAEAGVGSHLVGMPALHDVVVLVLDEIGLRASLFVCIPSAAAEVLPVDADGDGVPLEEMHALIPGEARDVVIVLVERSLWRAARIVAVVDVVVPPVAEETQGSAGAFVLVAQADACQAACDAGIVVEQRSRDGPRVAAVEVRDVGIGKSLPVVGELVAELHIAAELFELAVGSVAVAALVLSAHDTAEPAHTEAVHTIGLHGSVAAALQSDVGLAAVLVHLTGNNVQHTAHGIASI